MLKITDMDNGTKGRTLLRAMTSAGVAVAVWQYVFEKIYETTKNVAVAATVATVIALFILFVDAYTMYMNQDYTAEAQVGTNATRLLKADPTIVVEVEDGDEDTDDLELNEVDEKGDEIIKEGDSDEVE